MPMVLDGLLGLPHVDWAGLEHAPPRSRPVRKATPKHKKAVRHRKPAHH
jgi:beta-lactamase class C